jgi:hypothetical protein
MYIKEPRAGTTATPQYHYVPTAHPPSENIQCENWTTTKTAENVSHTAGFASTHQYIGKANVCIDLKPYNILTQHNHCTHSNMLHIIIANLNINSIAALRRINMLAEFIREDNRHNISKRGDSPTRI